MNKKNIIRFSACFLFWRTYFLTPRGVGEQQQDNIFKDYYNYVLETYLPYDY